MLHDKCVILFSLLMLQLYSESIVGYSEIPGQSHETHVLKNVNKLRESLFKCPNAVVFYDQIQVSFFISMVGFFVV